MNLFKKILYGSLPTISVWVVFILHKFSGLDIAAWYGFPLIVTYVTVVLLSLLITIWKLV